MKIKSEFRKLFWLRIGIGIFLFLSILSFCTYGFLNPGQIKMQLLIVACIILLFLIYVSLDLFKVFTLKITKNGIEKTSLIFRTKKQIPFTSIFSIEKQKVRSRNTRGYISDGFTLSILKLDNGKSLIISPDSFENYPAIIEAIEGEL